MTIGKFQKKNLLIFRKNADDNPEILEKKIVNLREFPGKKNL